MVNFYETKSYFLSGFTEDQRKYFKEHHLSQKGVHLWIQINKLNRFARNLCSTHDVSWRFNESCCYRMYKHLPFQCDYNDNETLASYAKRNYDFGNIEQIEEFVAFKGAYEIASLLEIVDDAPYKSESFSILKYCMVNYEDENCYITENFKGLSPQEEETNAV